MFGIPRINKHTINPRYTGLLVLFITSLALPPAAQAAAFGKDMIISDARPLRLDPHRRAGAPDELEMEIDAYGRSFVLSLEKNERLIQPISRRLNRKNLALYKGKVVGIDKSWARISYVNGAYSGAFYDGHELYLIDSRDLISGAILYEAMREGLQAATTDRVIYRASDIASSASCGVAGEQTSFEYQALVEELIASAGDNVAFAAASQQLDVSIVADTEYAGTSGGDTQGQVIAQMNIVDGIFSEQVGVHLSISGIVELSNNGSLTSTDPATLLNDFRSYVNNSQVGNPGLAHLFTGKDLNGSTIGIAYLNVLCSSFGVGVTQAGGRGTTGALTAAHEFGHNFAAPHDNQSGSACAGTPGSFLMSPSINGSNDFSQCSLDQMAPAIAAASCLTDVSGNPPPPPAGEVLVDNLDASTSQIGSWSVSSAPNPWDGQSLYSNSAGTFRWSPDLSEAGSYEVYSWWTYHANRSANVPYRIGHADGVATVPVDQSDASLGGQWVLLGTYNFDGDGSGYVEVSSENGQASADAVRLVNLGDPAPPPPPPPPPPAELILDDLDTTTSQIGAWNLSSGPNPWDGQSVYSNSGGTFRWSPNLSAAGSYEVYGWWTYHANRASNVPYRIGHADGVASVLVTQNDSSLGGQWVLLGTYNFVGDGSGYVEVSSENGQASADAVRLVNLGDPAPPPPPPPAEIILDDLDATTTQVGAWTVSSGPNPWDGQSVYSDNGGSFRWSPDLSEAGSYQVYGWWTYHANRSSNVPYRIGHTDGIASVSVDQNDSALGGQWVLLGTYNFAADGSGYVEVSSENGQASADAVRLVLQ